MARATFLFKPDVLITAVQSAEIAQGREQRIREGESSAYRWDKQKIEDALGFTKMINKFETVATSLGAVTRYNNNRWENHNSAIGVPTQMALRLAALKNLRDSTMTQYSSTFEALMGLGSMTMKEARNAAIKSAEAVVNVQLKIIDEMYPSTYHTLVEKGLKAKLERDQSGLTFA